MAKNLLYEREAAGSESSCGWRNGQAGQAVPGRSETKKWIKDPARKIQVV